MLSRPCRVSDIAIADNRKFQSRIEIRTVSDFDISPGFFRDVAGFLKPGDRIDIVRYVNETWTAVVAVLSNIRVVSVNGEMVDVVTTADMAFTGHVPERGFVIDRGPPVRVRHDGVFIGTFNTLPEARELVSRKGYAVREDKNAMVLVRRGEDVGYFDSAKKAWSALQKALDETEVPKVY